MTSPGAGWFGGFLDDTLGQNKSSGGSAPGTGKITTQQASPYGSGLYDVLGLPPGKGDDLFMMTANPTAGQFRSIPLVGSGMDRAFGENGEMSVAAGLEWLRDQAVNNTEGYNSLVIALWQAGYLDQSDIK